MRYRLGYYFDLHVFHNKLIRKIIVGQDPPLLRQRQ
jgi:hypothetical protein